jgi:hypothetical protein
MPIKRRNMDALPAARAFFEIQVLLTLMKQMLVESLNLNDLVAILALGEHWTVLPKVKVHSFSLSKGRVALITELAFIELLLAL